MFSHSLCFSINFNNILLFTFTLRIFTYCLSARIYFSVCSYCFDYFDIFIFIFIYSLLLLFCYCCFCFSLFIGFFLIIWLFVELFSIFHVSCRLFVYGFYMQFLFYFLFLFYLLRYLSFFLLDCLFYFFNIIKCLFSTSFSTSIFYFLFYTFVVFVMSKSMGTGVILKVYTMAVVRMQLFPHSSRKSNGE